MNPNFLKILDRAKETHQKKGQDYTTNPDENPYENFDRANIIISWFPDVYKSYAGLIAQKLARLGALLTSKRAPNNESIDDTFLDLVVYVILLYCKWKDNSAMEFCEHEQLNCNGYCLGCKNYIPDAAVHELYSYSPDSRTYHKR